MENLDLKAPDFTNGELFQSLERNNKAIKRDRAIAIVEDAELTYRRLVEDLRREIITLNRERNSMLDLSPTDANSLILANDFKSNEFVRKDIELGIKIREAKIKLEIAETRYSQLFKNA
jgi:hypothetical protein